ncbi:hypothetical protein [Kingella potus]|uniref:hypothetical protein n=1 Tax=Kingella potus TaxID=265175 RepID=UPI000E1C12DE|nr:hypothetical protein [Kingella potus]UOP01162.1 hypothetical protein LVJ84_02260 [Kingella potus]
MFGAAEKAVSAHRTAPPLPRTGAGEGAGFTAGLVFSDGLRIGRERVRRKRHTLRWCIKLARQAAGCAARAAHAFPAGAVFGRVGKHEAV